MRICGLFLPCPPLLSLRGVVGGGGEGLVGHGANVLMQMKDLSLMIFFAQKFCEHAAAFKSFQYPTNCNTFSESFFFHFCMVLVFRKSMVEKTKNK